MSEWRPYPAASNVVPEHHRFVARQPILDRMQRTFGYELLFRTGWENRFHADGETASHHMIDNAVSYGMESLVGDLVPFVNCTRQLMLKRLPTLLPRHTVLEVLEDSEVDDDLLNACRELRTLGYPLAIDDYDFDEKWERLIPFVDMIKVDFRASTRQQRETLLYRLKYRPIRFVAEKIETREEFRQGLDEGFHLFQGYFFNRPVVLARRSITAMVNKVRILYELSAPTPDRNQMLRMAKEEPAVSVRLLRMANSAVVSAREPIRSLRSALALIGDEQFRKLALMAMATEFSGTGAMEPIRFILQRARFCELMAPCLGLEPSEMYLLGMLSVMCSALNFSVSDLTGTDALRPDVVAALNGTPNVYGNLLVMAQSYENGQWDRVAAVALEMSVTEEQASSSAALAQQWTESIMSVL